jgi:phage terminase large subunit
MLTVTTAIRKLSKLRKRKRVIQGSTSAGKTFGIIALLIDQAIKKKYLEISIVAESVPHLRRGALKDFMHIMMTTNRYIDAHMNKSTLKYTFASGSFIEFFSVDQPDKLRGARRNILYINEANNIPHDAYVQLATRTSGDIWLDFNPTSRFWAHNDVLQSKDAELLKLTYKDNEALAQTIIDEIESAQHKTSAYWKNWWTVFGLGEIGSLDGACIPEWGEVNTIDEDARLLGYGMDFGYSNDPTTIIAMYKLDDTYIYDELLCKTRMTNNDISDFLKANQINDYIYADSAEPKSIKELQMSGHNVIGARKGQDSIMYGLNLINQNKIFVTSRSKNLIQNLQNYTFRKDKDGSMINKPIDAFNDCIDAMRYVTMETIGHGNRGEYHIY